MRGKLLGIGILLGFFGITLPVNASPYTFTTLDDPFATNGTQAYGINDSGQIVGAYSDGTSGGSRLHGFLASPTAVSAPGTLPLFASGLCVLGLVDWCRKKKAATLAAA